MLDTSKLKDMKVLIVDDQSDNLKVLYNTLKPLGYDISLAATGQQAINHISEHRPDLILLDITLPDINGIDVCRKIKEYKATENIPVIFISACTDSSDVVKGFDVGCVDYIRKPFVETEVIARVQNHLTLKFLHENLERRVVERTHELEKAKVLAETANQAKTQFLSRMTHEFKTPLNSILGFSQLQEQQIAESDTNNLVISREYIFNAGTHLLSLVENVLDLAHMENQQLKLPLEKVSINETLESSININREMADEAGISIDYNLLEVSIQGNKHRLEQVFNNLLTNAIKFNFKHGMVSINVKIVDDDQVEVSFMDSGVGIADEDEERIFMPFTRLAYAEKHEIPGAGIGLSQSKYLVEEMNGSIDFHSQLGQGSVFSVRFPRAKNSQL